MPHLASPNAWVLLAAVAAAALLLRNLLRTSHDYPLRGKLIGFTGLVVLTLTLVLGRRAAPAVREMASRADQMRRTFLASRPAEPLAAYVPIPSVIDSVRVAESATPALGGNRPSAGWIAHTTDGARVIRFYRDSSHRVGWTLELSADSMLVLARARSALGQRGVERMSIRLRAPAAVEYELTRTYGPRHSTPVTRPAPRREAASPLPAGRSEEELLSEAGLSR